MNIPDILSRSSKAQFSFELLPPLKGQSIEEINKTIDTLIEFKPPYINITYHKEETVYKKRSDGLIEKKIIRKRPGTVAIAAAIKNKYKDITVVPHLICGGFSKEETENALIDLNYLGINNLLILRGDADIYDKIFTPEINGHKNAIDLIHQVSRLNEGKYLDQELENPKPLNFTMGVAGYPEKHVESPNYSSDLQYLKNKVDAGAKFIVTQMFFDNQKYFDFVKSCRLIGVTVPIIPGLKPISVKKQIFTLPKVFNIDLPNELVKSILKCKTNSEVRQVGIEWTVQQSKALIKNNVPSIHYYTMGKPDNIYQIAKKVF